MSDNLKQLNLEYVPVEDRVILRMSTRSGSLARFWVTRRMVVVLWNILQQGIERQREVAQQSDPETRQAVREFQSEAAVKSSNFASKFDEDGLVTPLGEEPILVTELVYGFRENEQLSITLRSNKEHPGGTGAQASIGLDRQLLYSFCHLLVRVVTRADWGLALEMSEMQAQSDVKEKPPVVH